MALNYLSSSSPPPSITSSISPPPCPSHPQEFLTNFCCLLECLEPLCPECIDYHNKLHRKQSIYPEIDTLKNVRGACFKKVRAAILSLSSLTSSLSSALPSSLFLLESGLNTLSEVRQRVIALVNSYFDEMESSWRKRANESGNNSRNAENFFNKAKGFLDELGFLQNSLENGNNLVTVLRKICALDLKAVIDALKEEGERMLEKRKWEDEILYIPEKMGELERELVALIRIRAMEEEEGKRKDDGREIKRDQEGWREAGAVGLVEEKVKRGGKSNHSSPIHAPSSFKSPPNSSFKTASSFLPNQASLLPPLSSILPQNSPVPAHFKATPLKVSLPDFFDQRCKRKVLHFFPNNQKVLHFLDFNEIKGGEIPHFSTLKLDIEFKIPHFHKSVITPMGDIYLTGGTPSGPSSSKSRDVFILDWSKPTLYSVSPMISARSSHSICYCSGQIYVIGGFTTGQTITAKCEKLELPQENSSIGGLASNGAGLSSAIKSSWTSIASLNYGVVAACVCRAGEKYLFKFGGLGEGLAANHLIERYDIERDVWKMIQLEEQHRSGLSSSRVPKTLGLLSTSACVQINRNEILIFGGYNEANEASDSCWIFTDAYHPVHEPSLKKNYRPIGMDSLYYENGDLNEFSATEKFGLIKLDNISLPFSEGFWSTGVLVMGGIVWTLQNVANEKNDDCLENDRRILTWDGNEWKSLN